MVGSLLRALVLGVTLLLVGCVSLRPVAPVVDGPDGVRVLVTGFQDGQFKLEVVNYGAAAILVDGERVLLITAAGARACLPGSAGRRDDVPPGGHQALDVRFALGGVRTGDRVALSLDGAVTRRGQPLRVPPLEFVAD